MFQKIRQFTAAHKIITFIIVVAAIGAVYYAYKSFKGNGTETRYVLANVEKGTITASVSGSGQVSVSQQLDVKPKVSAVATSVVAKQGQEVRAGSVLVQLDARDAQKAVRDANLSLETSLLAMEKLKQPVDKLTLLQAQNALEQAKRELADLKKPPEAIDLLQAQNALSQANLSKQQAEDNLKKGYDDGFNTVATAFLDLPTVISGLEDMLLGKTIDRQYQNIDWYANQATDELSKALSYRSDLLKAYNTARTNYDNNFNDYKATSRSSDTAVLEKLISETYDTTKSMADAVKSANNYIDYLQDYLQRHNITVPSVFSTHQSLLDTYTSKTNTSLSNLLAIRTNLQNYRDAITNADRTIAEKTELLDKLNKGADENTIKTAEEKIREKEASLAKIKKGTDPLDIRSQELTIKQKRNALSDAQDKLADYSVRAPFAGIIAKVNVKKNDDASSSTAVATLITKQRIAEITLNEVDIAKVKAKQKTTLTFDAVEGLTISGEVAEVDSIGTVSQGVVTYGVKIIFDTQDERVKPGMSVSATVITDVKQDVLFVPNSAVKAQGDANYVEVFDQTMAQTNASQGVTSALPPRQQPVEVGLSNDTSTEIISGLKEGDQIVVKTITVASTAKTTNQQGIPGLFGGGGPPPGGGGPTARSQRLN